MAMTLGTAKIESCVESLSNREVATILVQKLSASCSDAFVNDVGGFLPIDDTGYWLFVGYDGTIELGEPGM